MSLSDCNLVKEGEFAYHTRLVVYKYLGLFPTRGFNQNESSVADESTGSSSKSIPWELSSLPQVSLIDKLRESEEHYAKNKRLCDELIRKVKRVSSESPKSESQRSSQTGSNQESHACLPKKLLQEIRLRGGFKSEVPEDNMQQMTVIQKQSKVRVYIDQIKCSDSFETVHFRDDKVRFQGDDSTVEEDSFGKSGYKEVLSNSLSGSNMPSAKKSLCSQVSMTSCSSRRCNAYVDINEVDEETLKSMKSLPSSAVSLKKEISEAINLLESEYNPFVNQSYETSPDDTSRSSAEVDIDAVYQVADTLRVVGDRLNDHGIDYTVDELVARYYAEEGTFQDLFQDRVLALLDGMAFGWSKVALLLTLGQRLMLRLFESGSHEVSHIGEMMASLIQQHLGDFILSNGGWFGINNMGLLEQPLDLPNVNHVLDLMDTIGEDTETARSQNVGNNTANILIDRTISPIYPPSHGTIIKDGSTRSNSDVGTQNGSQDLPSSPTGEPKSFETVVASNKGPPDKSVGSISSDEAEWNGGTKAGDGDQSAKECVESRGENVAGNSAGPRPDLWDAEASSFHFVSECFGVLSAERALKLSLLIGGLFLIWKSSIRKS